MDYIQLGKSDLNVSRLGFGCCPMGGHGWGKVDSNELSKAVLVALDNGVNFFDTADTYGLGESEKRLGCALKERRKDAVIATKFGVRRDSNGKTFYDNTPSWITKALNGSLKRLNVDYIDLYQLHYWDNKTPFSDIIEALEKNKTAGKIRYYGISNLFFKDFIEYPLPEAMVSFQAQYSLLNRSNEKDIKEIIRKKKLTFLSWGSLGQGLLSGKYNVDTTFPANDRRRNSVYINFQGEKLKKNLRIVEAMKRIADHKRKKLTQIAIRWILGNLSFGVVLVGIKTPEQILENVGAFEWSLENEELKSLNEISSIG